MRSRSPAGEQGGHPTAVEELFEVKVLRVNTQNRKGNRGGHGLATGRRRPEKGDRHSIPSTASISSEPPRVEGKPRWEPVYKPTTAGRRNATGSDFAELTPGVQPEKSLLRPKRRTGGRNNQGRITVRHRGGGHKRRYRLIDFRRNKDGVPGLVKTIEYDPNRSARIALVHYADGEKRYILAPDGLKLGAQVMSGPGAAPAVGNCLPLAEIPLGTDIHNIEVHPGRGGAMCRSAGARATLAARDAGWSANQSAEWRNPPRAGQMPGDDRAPRAIRNT